MSREKQIEEMAKIIGIPCYKRINEYGDGSQECPSPLPCNECTAELLYKAGYRKQEWIGVEDVCGHPDPVGETGVKGEIGCPPEVAREIFEEIEKHMIDLVDITNTAYKEIGTATFAALKKKYTEGET